MIGKDSKFTDPFVRDLFEVLVVAQLNNTRDTNMRITENEIRYALNINARLSNLASFDNSHVIFGE